jgi:formyltetrahydrofolate deformylase
LKNTAILLVQCPDRKGLDATIADFVYRHDGNILHFEQHQAGEGPPRLYLARVEWSLDGFQIDPKEFPGKFALVTGRSSNRELRAFRIAMTWETWWRRAAILKRWCSRGR